MSLKVSVGKVYTLRVRCNGRGLLPYAGGGSSVHPWGAQYVGWRRISNPRFHAADVALNVARRAVGLPTCDQVRVGGDDLVSVRYYVPRERTTTLRASGDRLRYYAHAIVDGDLLPCDEHTWQVAVGVEAAVEAGVWT